MNQCSKEVLVLSKKLSPNWIMTTLFESNIVRAPQPTNVFEAQGNVTAPTGECLPLEFKTQRCIGLCIFILIEWLRDTPTHIKLWLTIVQRKIKFIIKLLFIQRRKLKVKRLWEITEVKVFVCYRIAHIFVSNCVYLLSIFPIFTKTKIKTF